MEFLKSFFVDYGVTAILLAILGIAILGTFKYWGIFKNIAQSGRHYCYLLVSAVLTVVITIIYLACTQMLTLGYFLSLALLIYALNQMLYNVFKVTPINALFVTILDFFKEQFTKRAEKRGEDSVND